MIYTNNKNNNKVIRNVTIKQRFDNLITKSVKITEEDINNCKSYIESIDDLSIYAHLVPNDIKDTLASEQIIKQNLFIEEISIIALEKLFAVNNISEIPSNVTVKTSIDKDIHKRIMITKEEFESNKNYYIGMHLNLSVEDKKHPVKRHLAKGLYNIKEIQVYGYLENKFIKELKYKTIKNNNNKNEMKFFTKKSNEYKDAKSYTNISKVDYKWYYLDKMLPINNLIQSIKKK